VSVGEGVILAVVVASLVAKFGLFLVVRGYLRRAEELLAVVKGWANLGRSDHEQAREISQRAVAFAAEMDSGPVVKSVEQVKQAVEEVRQVVGDVPKQVAAEIKKDSSHG
jgi:hypothetical protein